MDSEEPVTSTSTTTEPFHHESEIFDDVSSASSDVLDLGLELSLSDVSDDEFNVSGGPDLEPELSESDESFTEEEIEECIVKLEKQDAEGKLVELIDSSGLEEGERPGSPHVIEYWSYDRRGNLKKLLRSIPARKEQ